MLVEYTIKFTEDGVTVTQRVEPGPLGEVQDQDSGSAVHGKVLSASVAETQALAKNEQGGNRGPNPTGPFGGNRGPNPTGPFGGNRGPNPTGPFGGNRGPNPTGPFGGNAQASGLTVIFGPIVITAGCPPSESSASATSPAQPDQQQVPPAHKSPAKKKAAVNKRA
jgi:hypothetical protein